MSTQKTPFTRILLAPDPRNPRCTAAASDVQGRLRKAGFATAPVTAAGAVGEEDLLVVLGGDGSLMRTLAALGYPPLAVFGVNFGQVGFLMNGPDAVTDIVAILREGRWRETKLPVLSARAIDAQGEREFLAINDFVLERLGSQTARLDVFIEGVLLNRYSGDGLIVATGTGSTAYTLAAGGPAVHPAVDAMIITPVNPHRPVQFHSLQFPLVLPLGARLEIRVVDRSARAMRLVADGAQTAEPESAVICWSGRKVRLLRTPDFSYVSALVQKVIGS
ncbi:MAG TPA: NAD(+)/NADH kinase [Planctomycetota bacterium]|jgi:NAD+ kinase|nr:NAD(+)/NADH kinase [Planctomycetota bacterium]OQC21251.1 MAG: putative inorganic polyphosphate/ATP-NAD kinase [Planctomycetes bacterium ADurb.Bin069]HNS00284.1 NAD(+)/NADH kinase [Planctomycetota bacterium]HOE31028.1 NAD(+)/NADH kinase [Planctomycetota bacterium]HOE86867.1 NAD(+)/NADH kinase [Planctomycetota bacterium]